MVSRGASGTKAPVMDVTVCKAFVDSAEAAHNLKEHYFICVCIFIQFCEKKVNSFFFPILFAFIKLLVFLLKMSLIFSLSLFLCNLCIVHGVTVELFKRL